MVILSTMLFIGGNDMKTLFDFIFDDKNIDGRFRNILKGCKLKNRNLIKGKNYERKKEQNKEQIT